MNFINAAQVPYLSSSQLYLIILPTESCNLRCIYCFERFENSSMRAPILRGIKNLLSKRASELKDLTIGWFGGEPLLARRVIENVHCHVHALVAEYPQIKFRASMTTNAYLLSRKVFKSLVELGITEYQIAFDGPREWHDRKRVLPDGRGTFDRIWKNVTALREVPGQFKVILRINVDRENQKAVPEFIDQCRETFKEDKRFQLFICALARLGGPNDSQLCTLEHGIDNKRIDELRKLVASRKLKQYTEKDLKVPCYAAWANSFVVRSDGRINKCSAVLYSPGNQVGRLHEDGTVELNKIRMLAWMRGLFSERSEELDCPASGFEDPCAD